MQFYETTIRTPRTMDDGSMKTVTETYLLQADSFTMAETVTLAETTPFAIGEVKVIRERITNISEVVPPPADEDAGDHYYLAKFNIITLNENTGREKLTQKTVVIEADTLDQARSRYRDFTFGSVSDTRLVSIAETKYIDYFPFNNAG